MEVNMEKSWRDICICHPPLKMNYSGNMIYITYDLDAICPHCKAPFRECKPELIISNLETQHKMMQEELEQIGLEYKQELEEAERLSKLSIYDFIFSLLFIFFIIYFLIK